MNLIFGDQVMLILIGPIHGSLSWLQLIIGRVIWLQWPPE